MPLGADLPNAEESKGLHKAYGWMVVISPYYIQVGGLRRTASYKERAFTHKEGL